MRFCMPCAQVAGLDQLAEHATATWPKSKKSRCHSILQIGVRAGTSCRRCRRSRPCVPSDLLTICFQKPTISPMLLVDEHLLVLVDPVLQALHLQTQCDVADLVARRRTSRLPWARCSSRRWRRRCRSRPTASSHRPSRQSRLACSHRSTQSLQLVRATVTALSVFLHL